MGGNDDNKSLFVKCSEAHNGQTDSVLQCISDGFQTIADEQATRTTSWLLLLAAALVFVMQAGFIMVCAGSVRKKNMQNTMLKNVLDICIAAIAFYCLGYAFAFGGDGQQEGNTFVGTQNFALTGSNVNPSDWFFQYGRVAAALAIAAGSLAERCQMAAYLSYSVYLAGFVYPVVAHAIWSDNGILSFSSSNPIMGESGCIDFAGGGVVHMTGGTTALVGTYILGSRRGRFYDMKGKPLTEPKKFPGHSIALQMLGTMILWFGWYGFNSGSALVLSDATNSSAVAGWVAVNSTLSAAMAAIAAFFTKLFLHKRSTGDYCFDLIVAMKGALSGLAAITAPCGTVTYYSSIVIGLIAGWIYLGSSHILNKWHLDDAVDALPVHFFNGVWGMVAVGLLSAPAETQAAYGSDEFVGYFYALARGSPDATLLGAQMVALLLIFGWTLATMLPYFFVLNYFGWLRADALEEMVGLDTHYHGGTVDSDEEVKEKYIEAYNKQRDELKKKGTKNTAEILDDMSWGDANASADKKTKGPEQSQPKRPEKAPEAPPESSSSMSSNVEKARNNDVSTTSSFAGIDPMLNSYSMSSRREKVSNYDVSTSSYLLNHSECAGIDSMLNGSSGSISISPSLEASDMEDFSCFDPITPTRPRRGLSRG